ncbi:MAG: energy-coupling factor transporter transmembrane protein EcfT [bacterium]
MELMKNITLGQFIPGDSLVHRLDPRVKIALLFLIMVQIFATDRLLPYGLLMVFILLAAVLAKLKLKFFIRGLKPILILIAITFFFNAVFAGGRPLVSFWKFTLTGEGLHLGAAMSLRLILLILSTSLLTLTTSPIQMTDALESLLSPFRRVGLPAHELAMMTTIALRFIPLMLEETEKIMKAQMARGAEFERGSLYRRARSLIPILVPLFVHAFRHAEELAVAMEARCYRGGEGRTRLKTLRVSSLDLWACLWAGAILVLIATFHPPGGFFH